MKRRRVLAVLACLLSAGAAFLIADGWLDFGDAATGARRERMESSRQFDDGVFTNPQPLWNDFLGSLNALANASDFATPTQPVAILVGDGARFKTPPPSALRITWLGHSSLLIEIEGKRLLLDPVFGERASPYDWVGPKRWYAPPIPFEELPAIDAVILSHDHYDHLQRDTIERMLGWSDTVFIAPLGVGAHLEYWGIPAERIVELDWWERTKLGGLEVVCTPARHASGRHLLDQNATLWAGFAFIGPSKRAFFSGDTGLFPAMKEIGDKLGPFDVTMIEVGAYARSWPDWHIGPEQAVKAHGWLRGRVFLPIHWGLWNLAAHGWTEPAERVLAAAAKDDVTVTIPRPGQSIEPAALPPLERWWPNVPWKTAAEDPIVSTLVD